MLLLKVNNQIFLY